MKEKMKEDVETLFFFLNGALLLSQGMKSV